MSITQIQLKNSDYEYAYRITIDGWCLTLQSHFEIKNNQLRTGQYHLSTNGGIPKIMINMNGENILNEEYVNFRDIIDISDNNGTVTFTIHFSKYGKTRHASMTFKINSDEEEYPDETVPRLLHVKDLVIIDGKHHGLFILNNKKNKKVYFVNVTKGLITFAKKNRSTSSWYLDKNDLEGWEKTDSLDVVYYNKFGTKCIESFTLGDDV